MNELVFHLVDIDFESLGKSHGLKRDNYRARPRNLVRLLSRGLGKSIWNKSLHEGWLTFQIDEPQTFWLNYSHKSLEKQRQIAAIVKLLENFYCSHQFVFEHLPAKYFHESEQCQRSLLVLRQGFKVPFCFALFENVRNLIRLAWPSYSNKNFVFIKMKEAPN
jgi:hypothetical protein